MLPPETIERDVRAAARSGEWDEKRLERELELQQNAWSYLNEIHPDQKGRSPLHQAMMLLASLQGKDQQSGQGDGEGELPVFGGRSDAKAEAKAGMDTIDSVEEMTPEEKELLEPSDSSGEGHGELKSKVELAKDLGSDGLRREIAKLSRSLDRLSALKTANRRTKKVDPNGRQIHVRSMESLSDLPHMTAAERALFATNKTLFWNRVATRAVQIREKVNITEEQQLLYLLLDCSGSMGHDGFAAAGGALMNRLTAVVRGEAVLYWRLFDGSPHKEHVARDATEAAASFKTLTQRSFSGGGTSIETAMITARDRCLELGRESGGKLGRPQILIVTDGGDSVDPDMQMEGITVNVLLCNGAGNGNLEQIAKQSGGVVLKM